MEVDSWLKRSALKGVSASVGRGRRSSLGRFKHQWLSNLIEPIEANPAIGEPRPDRHTRVFQSGGYSIEYGYGSLYRSLKRKPNAVFTLEPKDQGNALWIVGLHAAKKGRVELKPRRTRRVIVKIHASSVRTATTKPVTIPKIPRLMQRQVDELIEKSKSGAITSGEQTQLDEVLDYLDELTLYELQRAAGSVN